MSSQDCNTEISAHITQFISQHSTTTNFSVPPALGHIRSPTPKTTSVPHETIPTISPSRLKTSTLIIFINMVSIDIDLTFQLLRTSLPAGLEWYTEIWGTNHRALLPKLLMTNHKLSDSFEASPIHRMQCLCQLQSCFLHTRQSTQGQSIMTTVMSMVSLDSKQSPC